MVTSLYYHPYFVGFHCLESSSPNRYPVHADRKGVFVIDLKTGEDVLGLGRGVVTLPPPPETGWHQCQPFSLRAGGDRSLLVDGERYLETLVVTEESFVWTPVPVSSEK